MLANDTSPLSPGPDIHRPLRPRTIRVIAPSGYTDRQEDAQRALERWDAEGHRVENTACIQRKFERFAGTDTARRDELNALADRAQPLPDIVMALRGGYGAIRLLEGLDYDALRERFAARTPIIVGYSDFTAIHMALLARAGTITFAGPMFTRNVGQESASAYTLSHFWGLIQSDSYTIAGEEPRQPTLDVRGTLWGGNLAMLASLCGTPYMPIIDGGILFIEDIHEQPFRTERMLYQLHLSGILQRQQAIVMGTFSESAAIAYNNGFTLSSVAEQIARISGVPVITGLPFGHIDDMVTLPVGAQAHLLSGAHGFSLTLSGYPRLE